MSQVECGSQLVVRCGCGWDPRLPCGVCSPFPRPRCARASSQELLTSLSGADKHESKKHWVAFSSVSAFVQRFGRGDEGVAFGVFCFDLRCRLFRTRALSWSLALVHEGPCLGSLIERLLARSFSSVQIFLDSSPCCAPVWSASQGDNQVFSHPPTSFRVDFV